MNDSDDRRARLLLDVAAQLHGGKQHVALSDLLGELDGEDLNRVLEAIAVLKRRKLGNQASPADLWIRAAEPDLRQRE